ncbi:hypothetical protein INT47_010297 [Mucor saturninus]|uniref:Uncharacterized protein n=1 Tax=Mucor saturninus TaxID=64648 RepID=A0A8H7UYK4_9FUNG|nr:hypothetical protein INT47_010297 [Mucor saturninus]
MKACVSVDYLSHEWSCSDLIQAHRELRRQKSKTAFAMMNKPLTRKEQKKFSMETVRQVRYQNAIWREMARSCTNNLSGSNPMIHPSAVNWQKESDITWLYGPLYMPPESSSDLNTHPSLSFLSPTLIPPCTKKPLSLKPVLKKRAPTSVMLQRDYWITNDRYWSKCVSESGKQSVRFNPNITQVKYLPETPVKESLHKSSYFDLDSDNEEEDEDEDEEIWKVLLQVGSYLKSVLFISLFGPPQKKKEQEAQMVKTVPLKNNMKVLVQLCASAMSFTAWIMYGSFSTLLNRTPFASIRQTTTKKTSLSDRRVISV